MLLLCPCSYKPESSDRLSLSHATNRLAGPAESVITAPPSPKPTCTEFDPRSYHSTIPAHVPTAPTDQSMRHDDFTEMSDEDGRIR